MASKLVKAILLKYKQREKNKVIHAFKNYYLSNRKESLYNFLLKGLAVVSLLWIGGHFFAQKYSIGIDPQINRCLPKNRVYLVEREPATTIERGGIYLFISKDLPPFFKQGTKMLKYVRGLPGDKITINSDEEILVNDAFVDRGLSVATILKLPKEKFQGTQTLKAGEYWMMGNSPISFDSRYWGTVKRNAIVSRAYPIF